MSTDYRPRLTVDLGALRRNLAALRSKRPGAEVAPVVKADCYGLGAERVVSSLVEAGCRTFFVAYPQQAAELCPPVPDAVFYCYNAVFDGPWTDRIRPVLYRPQDVEAWAGGPFAVQIELGMERMGLTRSEIMQLSPCADVALVLGHMSDAGNPSSERNAEQRDAFKNLRGQLKSLFPHARQSLSATGAMLLPGGPLEDLVRPGIGLYGGAPGKTGALEPVAALEGRVLHIHDVPAGTRVGYDGTWTALKQTRIATLAIGYADGLPRHLSNIGGVVLGGRQCAIIGAVSMDLTTVDITGTEGVEPGDWAEIFGHHQKLDDLASAAGTIGYELLTRMSGRVVRHYVD